MFRTCCLPDSYVNNDFLCLGKPNQESIFALFLIPYHSISLRKSNLIYYNTGNKKVHPYCIEGQRMPVKSCKATTGKRPFKVLIVPSFPLLISFPSFLFGLPFNTPNLEIQNPQDLGHSQVHSCHTSVFLKGVTKPLKLGQPHRS